jgi:TatD DNase family protein
MIDTHCHLDRLAPEVLPSCFDGGVTAVIAPAMGEQSLGQLLALSRRWPGRVFPAAGVHPERPMTAALLAEARRVADWIDGHHRELAAIGEVGLPCYTLAPGAAIPETAFAVLDLFLDRAAKYDLPVILHAVHGAAQPCLERLLAHGVRRAVFHWLKAPDNVTARIMAAGYYASVTPEVTALARDQHIADIVRRDRLLLETDGPEPLRIARPGASTPLWVADSIRFLAARFQMTPQAAETLFDSNARALFPCL